MCVYRVHIVVRVCIQGAYRRASGSLSQGRVSSVPSAEECQISVPSAAVGAIIGSGGTNIKQIIRDSGAFVTVSRLYSFRLHFSRVKSLEHTRLLAVALSEMSVFC